MKNREKIINILIVFVLIVIILNLNTINNALTYHTDKTVQFGHSEYIVPETWNTTKEVNYSGEAKTENGVTNNYTTWDVWEDWPEDHMGSLSRSKFAAMEGGDYVTLNSTTVKLGGYNVSKEYFYNPSRNTTTQWDDIGVIYIFQKEDTNYAIEVHYFTDIDYHNQSYTKELDDRIEDTISNLENTHYIGIYHYSKLIWQLFNDNVLKRTF